MGRERAKESWFSNFWWKSRNKTVEPDKATVGILSFEVVRLMSRVVKLWHGLSDFEVARLKDEVLKSVGIKKLVSEDENYLMDLVLNEMIDELVYVGAATVRLSTRCSNPTFHRLELFFVDPVEHGFEWLGSEFKSKKMEKAVKKMDLFISAMIQFSQEQEVLVELEQTLRRMLANSDTDRAKLIEFQQKVTIHHQEVKYLQDSSPWNRTFDYVVHLLASSIFTIIERFKFVFGPNQIFSSAESNGYLMGSASSISRSQSFSALLRSSVHETNLCRFYIPSLSDKRRKEQQSESKSKKSSGLGPFNGCKEVGGSMRISSTVTRNTDKTQKNRIYYKLSKCYARHGISVAPPQSLGYAALAFQYAKVIILIEKLVQSPYPIGVEDREELYSMLPSSIKASVRSRVRSHTKASSGYDSSIVEQWSVVVDQMTDWLSPLAHNTVKWQSERNFEKQTEVSVANVLLVQTLYFANQLKTEAAVTDILVGICLQNPDRSRVEAD